MAKNRRSGPALYELIDERARVSSSRARGTSVPAERPAVEPKVAPTPQRVESPSRPAPQTSGELDDHARQQPLGVMLFAAAAVIGAWFFGYLIGHRQQSGEVDRLKTEIAALTAPATPLDPLNQRVERQDGLAEGGTTPEPRPNGPVEPGPDRNADDGSGNVQDPTPRRANASGVVVVEGRQADPRTRGLNYLTVAAAGRDRAVALAEHLEENGLDVVVVRVNSRLFRVVSLEGLSSEQYRAGQFRDHQERVRRVVEAYRDERGRQVPFDPLWDKF
jgi:hypothetical protein